MVKKTETRYYNDNFDKMILRDFLALDRTILANKRTFLAYVRTFIGLIASGVGMIKLVSDSFIEIVGWIFIIIAFPVLIIGIAEFIKVSISLSKIQDSEKDE